MMKVTITYRRLGLPDLDTTTLAGSVPRKDDRVVYHEEGKQPIHMIVDSVEWNVSPRIGTETPLDVPDVICYVSTRS